MPADQHEAWEFALCTYPLQALTRARAAAGWPVPVPVPVQPAWHAWCKACQALSRLPRPLTLRERSAGSTLPSKIPHSYPKYAACLGGAPLPAGPLSHPPTQISPRPSRARLHTLMSLT